MAMASVLTGYGPPDVLRWAEVDLPAPGPEQIRIRVQAAGVGPTDLKIRRGDLQAVFPLPARAVLGFEAAGVVDAIGSSVTTVKVGDGVAALLPRLGGYGEYALTSTWTPKPPQVSWADAAALPASAEAAVGVLRQLQVRAGESLLVLGGGGSVGVIAIQLARARGLTVYSAVGPNDRELVRDIGGVPISYGATMLAELRALTAKVDAVLDAAGRGGLTEAITLAGGSERVITLADEHAAELGVALSAPTPDRAPDALDQTRPLLATGKLRLRRQKTLAFPGAAQAHSLLESGQTSHKLILLNG